MDALTQLSGIGRKSANVIMRETGASAAGIVVDLHVVRVAPRIGLAKGTNPEKIEQQLMQLIDQNIGVTQEWPYHSWGATPAGQDHSVRNV